MDTFAKHKIQAEAYSDHSVLPIARLKQSASNMSFLFYCDICIDAEQPGLLEIAQKQFLTQFKRCLFTKSAVRYCDAIFSRSQLIYLSHTKREFVKIAELSKQIFGECLTQEERSATAWIEGVAAFDSPKYIEELVETLCDSCCGLK